MDHAFSLKTMHWELDCPSVSQSIYILISNDIAALGHK